MKKQLWSEYIFATVLIILAIATFTITNIADLARQTDIDFNKSFFDQMKYYSNWTLTVTLVYAIFTFCNAINKTPNSSLSCFEVFVVSINTVIGILYFAGLFTNIIAPKSNAANALDTWDKTAKAILGHLVIPAILLLHFFLYANEPRNLKEVMRKDAWKIMFYIGIYMLFALYRFLWLKSSGIAGNSLEEKRELFPYWFLSPDVLSWPGFFAIAIILLFGHMGIFIFYVYTGNCISQYWKNHLKTEKKSK
ncbi:hypothetical protein [Mesoplasma seiffertii]|uniref:hypothetical protein n=1 Tax=Mesoplasma seiffertii TaxID=28224 RepID=UPI00047D31ED|nr:hypothetical protein [Mesoplasma seiffertii]